MPETAFEKWFDSVRGSLPDHDVGIARAAYRQAIADAAKVCEEYGERAASSRFNSSAPDARRKFEAQAMAADDCAAAIRKLGDSNRETKSCGPDA